MSIKMSDFLAATAFFVAYCSLFLGAKVFWVFPTGIILTFIIMWGYFKWIAPQITDDDKSDKPDNKEKEEENAEKSNVSP